MALGRQINSDIRNGKIFRSFRPGLHGQFLMPLKLFISRAVFLFSEAKNGDFTRNNRDSGQAVDVPDGSLRVRLLELAVVPFVLSEASVPIMYRA